VAAAPARTANAPEELPASPTALMLGVYRTLVSYSVKRPDAWALATSAVQGMLFAVRDYYADYLTPPELEALEKSLFRTYVGVGITIVDDDEGHLVVS